MKNQHHLPSLFTLVRSLESVKIHFTLSSERDDYIMITAVVPGERWEIEISEDGGIEIEVFTSTGDIYGSDKLDELFKRFSD